LFFDRSTRLNVGSYDDNDHWRRATRPGSDAAYGRQSQPGSKGSGGIADFSGRVPFFLAVTLLIPFAELPS
jgi:hypothetical protein